MDEALPVVQPLAKPTQHFGMWVAFQYILLFISMYVAFIAFVGISEIAVDKYIPKTAPSDMSGSSLYYSNPYSSEFRSTQLKIHISAIIVTYPIFALLFMYLAKQELQNPSIKSIKARKTLIYFTLVVTFLMMIGFLIYTLFNFLNGSTTSNFLAHFALRLGVVGSIFGFLFTQVWMDRKQNV